MDRMNRMDNLFIFKQRKRKGEMMSRIKNIKTYMKSFPGESMKEIGLPEAAQVCQTTEQNISAHLAGSIWFEKTDKKGVYRLLDYPREYRTKKERLEDEQKLDTKIETKQKQSNIFGKKLVDNCITNPKQDLVKLDMNISATTPEQSAIDTKPKHSPTEELKFTNEEVAEMIDKEKESMKIVTKKTHYCPHCDKQILLS